MYNSVYNLLVSLCITVLYVYTVEMRSAQGCDKGSGLDLQSQ